MSWCPRSCTQITFSLEIRFSDGTPKRVDIPIAEASWTPPTKMVLNPGRQFSKLSNVEVKELDIDLPEENIVLYLDFDVHFAVGLPAWTNEISIWMKPVEKT